MTGRTFLHYIIEEKLGEGGAGTVYRARDTMQVRVVALRFLPAFLSDTPEEKDRVIAELRAAANLKNPATAQVYEVYESDEGTFVEMEYIEGVNLRERMKQAGAKYGESLPLRTVAAFSLQIAEALNEAQQRSIVHRDLKPENIIVTAKDQIKVMDFGLARLKSLAALKRTTTKVEDVAYQAPELLEGGEADPRTDVFSFGVIYFEMLTTRRPFHGDHEAAMRYAIGHDEHDELTKYRPEISVYAVFIVDNALVKHPVERYQSVRELITHLEYWRDELSGTKPPSISVAPAPPTPKAIPAPEPEEARKKVEQKEVPTWMVYASYAVTGIIFVTIIIGGIMWYDATKEEAETPPPQRLPVVIADVENATGDPNLSVLSGMFTSALEQSRHLNVLSRARLHDILTSMGRDTVTVIDEKQGSEICGHAKYHMLVVGSIGKRDETYTILVKVIDPAKNEYLYTDKEEGQGEASVPSMIDKLAKRIRAGLKESEDDIAASNPAAASLMTSNFEAYRHYFYGERLIDRHKFSEAQAEFTQAIALDASFGLAYARLIYAISDDGIFSNPSERDYAAKGLLYVTHIPERQRYLFDATLAIQDNGYVPALDTLREMEKAYPDDREMIHDFGDWAYSAGDFGSADKYLNVILHTEPDNAHAMEELAWTYRETGRYKEMLAEAKKLVATVHSEESYQLLASAYGENQMYADGIKEMVKARDTYPPGFAFTCSIAELQILAGQYDSAEANLISLAIQSNPLSAKNVAYERLSWLYAYEGKYGSTLKAYDDRIAANMVMGDTASLIVSELQKALCMSLLGNDAAGARAELYKALWYPPQYRTLKFTENVALANVLIGDYDAADNVVNNSLDPERLPDWWMPMYRLIENSAQGQCDDAAAQGDSVLATGPDEAKMWAYYYKGACLLANGQFDDAIKSLTQIGSINENASGLRGVLYPKSLYLIAKAYQGKGDGESAKKAYRKFLELWRNADSDMPEHKDAVAQLVSSGR